MDQQKHRSNPCLYFVVPCYNEEGALPKTFSIFLNKVQLLIREGLISTSSKVLFVNDGSSDHTWSFIKQLSNKYSEIEGISLSRNRGHQNALLAGLMYARSRCDLTISIDCDGQDDIDASDEMVKDYLSGYDIVYGVRDNRDSDTWFKRTSAESFYKLLSKMGVETVFNHADYRLLSSRALNELARYKEVNLFLRGMVPLIGFKSTSVSYTRAERIAGDSHYPLSKMVGLAVDGISSLSITPLHYIFYTGAAVFGLSIVLIVWAIVSALLGQTVSGWASIMAVLAFLGGLILLALGIIGEYVGKMYLEVKARPRYCISETTEDRS